MLSEHGLAYGKVAVLDQVNPLPFMLGLEPLVFRDRKEVAAECLKPLAGPASGRSQHAADRGLDPVSHFAGDALGLGLEGLAPVRNQQGHGHHDGHDQGDSRRPGQRDL